MDISEQKPPISQFTLNELITMSGSRERHGLQSECLTADTQSDFEAFHFPCRIDALIIGIGTTGEATISYNLQTFRLRKNTMFCFAPNTILQAESMQDFRSHVVVISSEFLRNMHINLRDLMPVMLQQAGNPCLELDDTKSRTICDFIGLIEQEVRAPEKPYSREIVRNLLTSIIYKIGNILHAFYSVRTDDTSMARDRSESYFKRFTELLGENYRKERSVGFYARQLCITPKYLTTLIKRVSGASVSDWIDRYVILEAKTLLKHSHMSIQEIAYYLNFPNQSFFGIDFKRVNGMSPTRYKESSL